MLDLCYQKILVQYVKEMLQLAMSWLLSLCKTVVPQGRSRTKVVRRPITDTGHVLKIQLCFWTQCCINHFLETEVLNDIFSVLSISVVWEACMLCVF